MNQNTQQIIALSDGLRSASQIASIVGLSARYVRKVMLRKNLPQLRSGAQPGPSNHRFVSGRRIDLDGYVLVTAPSDHPYARKRTNRDTKLILEHRLALEQVLGRYLLPEEAVDHIDGLTLHNAPSNLRLFAENPDHLRATITGRVPQWSSAGWQHLKQRHHLPVDYQPVDTYGQRRKLGEIRLHQILRAALSLGTDSPYLLGTSHHTTKAQIDMTSRSTIARALADLLQKWASDQTL